MDVLEVRDFWDWGALGGQAVTQASFLTTLSLVSKNLGGFPGDGLVAGGVTALPLRVIFIHFFRKAWEKRRAQLNGTFTIINGRRVINIPPASEIWLQALADVALQTGFVVVQGMIFNGDFFKSCAWPSLIGGGGGGGGGGATPTFSASSLPGPSPFPSQTSLRTQSLRPGVPSPTPIVRTPSLTPRIPTSARTQSLTLRDPEPTNPGNFARRLLQNVSPSATPSSSPQPSQPSTDDFWDFLHDIRLGLNDIFVGDDSCLKVVLTFFSVLFAVLGPIFFDAFCAIGTTNVGDYRCLANLKNTAVTEFSRRSRDFFAFFQTANGVQVGVTFLEILVFVLQYWLAAGLFTYLTTTSDDLSSSSVSDSSASDSFGPSEAVRFAASAAAAFIPLAFQGASHWARGGALHQRVYGWGANLNNPLAQGTWAQYCNIPNFQYIPGGETAWNTMGAFLDRTRAWIQQKAPNSVPATPGHVLLEGVVYNPFDILAGDGSLAKNYFFKNNGKDHAHKFSTSDELLCILFVGCLEAGSWSKSTKGLCMPQHQGGYNMQALVTQMSELGPTAIHLIGGLGCPQGVRGPHDKNLNALAKAFLKQSAPLYLSLGNREYNRWSGGDRGYRKGLPYAKSVMEFCYTNLGYVSIEKTMVQDGAPLIMPGDVPQFNAPNRYYTVRYEGKCVFFYIDSTTILFDEEQLEWLITEYTKCLIPAEGDGPSIAQTEWLILVTHHPILPHPRFKSVGKHFKEEGIDLDLRDYFEGGTPVFAQLAPLAQKYLKEGVNDHWAKKTLSALLSELFWHLGLMFHTITAAHEHADFKVSMLAPQAMLEENLRHTPKAVTDTRIGNGILSYLRFIRSVHDTPHYNSYVSQSDDGEKINFQIKSSEGATTLAGISGTWLDRTRGLGLWQTAYTASATTHPALMSLRDRDAMAAPQSFSAARKAAGLFQTGVAPPTVDSQHINAPLLCVSGAGGQAFDVPVLVGQIQSAGVLEKTVYGWHQKYLKCAVAFYNECAPAYGSLEISKEGNVLTLRTYNFKENNSESGMTVTLTRLSSQEIEKKIADELKGQWDAEYDEADFLYKALIGRMRRTTFVGNLTPKISARCLERLQFFAKHTPQGQQLTSPTFNAIVNFLSDAQAEALYQTMRNKLAVAGANEPKPGSLVMKNGGFEAGVPGENTLIVVVFDELDRVTAQNTNVQVRGVSGGSGAPSSMQGPIYRWQEDDIESHITSSSTNKKGGGDDD
jgi:hypothetical protein